MEFHTGVTGDIIRKNEVYLLLNSQHDTGLLTLARVAKEQGLVISGQQVLYGTGSTSAVPEYDAVAEAMTSRSLCLPLPVGQDRSISRSCRVNAGSRKPEL